MSYIIYLQYYLLLVNKSTSSMLIAPLFNVLGKKHREVRSKNLNSEFCREQPLTLHWDGKLMAELTGDKKSIGSAL